MNVIQLSLALGRSLQISTPPDFTSTVVSSQGSQIVLSSTPPPGSWSHGVLSVLTGPSMHEQSVIANVAGNSVQLFTSRPAAVNSLAGATVRLSGGPLASAYIFTFDPASITDIIDQGFSRWVTISVSNFSLEYSGIQRDPMGRNAHNQKRVYSVSILAETVTRGGSNQEEIISNTLEPLIFAEQVASIFHSFRSQETEGVYAVGDINVTMAEINRLIDEENAGPITLGALVSFDLGVKR